MPSSSSKKIDIFHVLLFIVFLCAFDNIYLSFFIYKIKLYKQNYIYNKLWKYFIRLFTFNIKNVIDFKKKSKCYHWQKKKKKYNQDTKNHSICWKIILKKLSKSINYEKVRDNCHYRGAAHSICNFKLNVPNEKYT